MGVIVRQALTFLCLVVVSVTSQSLSIVGNWHDIEKCDNDDGGITLPEGFCARVVADGIEFARHIAVNANGDVYVATLDFLTTTHVPGVVALRDNDGDGRFESRATFGVGGTGIAIRDGTLYASSHDRILRYALPAAQSSMPPNASGQVVVAIPDAMPHVKNSAVTFAFDDKGGLYVHVGATSNVCQEVAGKRESRGQDPCPELERGAGIWRFQAARSNQMFPVDGARIATGIRHVVAIAWHPSLNVLFAVQHGRGALHTLWPALFTPDQNANTPAEELLRIGQGENFGWPYCYYDEPLRRRVLGPEYGGDGFSTGNCGVYSLPEKSFAAHSAPNDLLFYKGQQFPSKYRNGAFIAFHGGYERLPFAQVGYNVSFVPMRNNRFADAEVELFATGFAGREVVMEPTDAKYRPVGLAEGPDGSLYIVDSRSGRLWRVMYRGS